MRRKYGISTISLVPWSFGHKGFEKSLDIAEELGLDGIQALPMRGWTLEPSLYARYLDDPWDKLIISFEGAWNSGTVIQALKRRFGFGKEGYPTFLDLYLFGFGRRPEQVLKTMDKVFGWEKYISHKFSNSGYRYLLEINSGIPMLRSSAERMAINAPVQGTSADLIKTAMIEADKLLAKKYGNSQMLLLIL